MAKSNKNKKKKANVQKVNNEIKEEVVDQEFASENQVKADEEVKVEEKSAKEKTKLEEKKNQGKQKTKKAKKSEPKTNKVKETVSELKKVTWPTFQKVVKNTLLVLGIVLIFTVVLFGIDYGLSWIYKLLTNTL